MKTMKEFVKENNIRINVEYADRNPNMSDDDWSRSAFHYKTVLKRKNKQMTVYFSKGSALTEEPTVEEVLNSIAMDSVSYLNGDSFEDFCSEFGYDTDSRRAEKTYNAVIRQGEKAENFLGSKLMMELVFETEYL